MDEDAADDAFLSDVSIEELIAAKHIQIDVPYHVEPASIDLCPVGKQTLLPVSFLPSPDEWIIHTLEDLKVATVDANTRLMPGMNMVTVTRLDLRLDLPPDVKAVFSPKSSIGRLDLNVRVMCDKHGRYDETPYGYKGAVYADMRSSSFPISYNPDPDGFGAPLTQVRFVRSKNQRGNDASLERTDVLTIAIEDGKAGWMSEPRDPTKHIAIGRSRDLKVSDFWRPIPTIGNKVILRRGAFYIMRSREALKVPLDRCAVLRQVEPSLSMTTAHLAGFADPFFGMDQPSNLVFELRNPETDMLVRDGQPIGILETHRLDRPASRPYGANRESYQGQGVRLSRCFAQT